MMSSLSRGLVAAGFILASGLLSIQAVADDAPRDLRAAYIDFPPLAYTDDQGNPAGDIIRLSEELAASSGLRLIWQKIPVNRIHRNLRNGDIDLWPTSGSLPALQGYTLETQPLDISIRLCAYSRAPTPALEHLAQLVDRQLILIRGYTYRGELDQVLAKTSKPPVVAPNHIAALELLNRGRGDYLIHFSHPMDEALAEYPVSGLRCDLLATWPLALVVSQQTRDAQGIVDALNTAQQNRRSSLLKLQPLLPRPSAE